MKLNKTLALALHRAMWTDMQTELGNNPTPNQRSEFKAAWILKYFPNENVLHNCFLCEYAFTGDNNSCCACPIRWPGVHCANSNFSYAKAPISDILALPEKGKWSTGLEAMAIYAAHDETVAVRAYYGYREELLSKASGLPGSASIEDHVAEIRKKEDRSVMQVLENFSGLKGEGCWVVDHVKAIQEKAVQQSTFSKLYGDTKLELAKASGHPAADGVASHIKAIQEKAVEEYFKKTPGAKLASMDVDQAFKQYADEQKAPIFHALAEASGLSAGNESVKAHISAIRSKVKSGGRKEALEDIFNGLSVFSGLSVDNWSITDHVKAIQERAKEQMEPYVKSSTLLLDTLNKYKDYLSEDSGLDRNRPVEDHIKEIYDDAFSGGRDYERERIMDKIGEMLNDQSTGETKNS